MAVGLKMSFDEDESADSSLFAGSKGGKRGKIGFVELPTYRNKISGSELNYLSNVCLRQLAGEIFVEVLKFSMCWAVLEGNRGRPSSKDLQLSDSPRHFPRRKRVE